MENYSLDDVEGKQGISFPDTSSGDSSLFTNLISSKIEGVLNQLNNGVQDARNNIGQFGNDLQTTKSSLIAIGEYRSHVLYSFKRHRFWSLGDNYSSVLSFSQAAVPWNTDDDREFSNKLK